ncbi:MAG: phytoene desaturase family protein [Desulfomonilaceae bacterium]
MYRAVEYDAVVVGSGPNGLAAAITMAREGKKVLLREARDAVGGGCRTAELTLPGFRHDVCSAVHPLAVASPFFRSLELERFGVEWIYPPACLAHPLDDEPAVMLRRSLETTAQGLSIDRRTYQRLVGGMLPHWQSLMRELLKPLGLPEAPFRLLGFGAVALRPAASVAQSRFQGKRAQALFAGCAAHAIFPLEFWSSAAFGVVMLMLGHAVGWPIAKGGSQAIVNALASCFQSFGGEIELGAPVNAMHDLPRAHVYLFDVTPRQLAEIAQDVLPAAYLRRLRRHKHGAGVFKVDWALKRPIPWRDSACLEAGALHLGGTLHEICEAERQVWEGVEPEKPFVLISQPSLFDQTRAPEGFHTAWGYCHTPHGSDADMSERIERQLERFAPGFRDCVVARHTMSPADMEAYNPNYIGGDIAGGVQTFGQLFLRPMGRWTAYATPTPGIYMCSSSMPPGGGVHGMCGRLAALTALADLSKRRIFSSSSASS